MKKRIISLLLAVCMCAQMLPVAFAEDVTASDGGNSVQEDQIETEIPANQAAPAAVDPAQTTEPQVQAETEEKSQSVEQVEPSAASTPTATPMTEAAPTTPEAMSAPEAEVNGTLAAATATPTIAPAAMQAATLAEGPAEGATVIGSGECGENLTWTEYSDGTLVIEGSGEMADYTWADGAPWSSDITKAFISEGISRIGDHAFYYARKLTKIALPEGITSIGGNAFNGCGNLVRVALPSSLTTIEYYAFHDCENLEYINLPESLTQIGATVFQGCDKLISAGPIGGDYNIEFEWKEKIPANAFEGANALASVVIPSGITSIAMDAFHGCQNLLEICIPESVISIGKNAFTNCSSLQHVRIPKETISIAESAFEGCNQLVSAGPLGSGSSYEFGWKDSIPANAMAGCEGLVSVEFPDSIVAIGDAAFSGCEKLLTIALPGEVTSIGASAFSGCDALTNVTIPGSGTTIGDFAFSGCANLENVTILEGVKTIGRSSFSRCEDLKTIDLPDSMEKIGDSAFQNCTSLSEVILPSGIQEVASATFDGCSELVSVVIPETVTVIGTSAFRNCKSLSGVDIPDGVTLIDDSAFAYCENLTSIEIPENAELSYWSFFNCSNLHKVVLNSSLHQNDVFYGTDIKTLILGENVRYINWRNFDGFEELDSAGPIGSGAAIQFAWSEAIPNSIFQNCNTLKSITLPLELKKIEHNTFYGCYQLLKVKVPDGVTSIDDNAFYGCGGLASIIIPNSVTSIGTKAFYGCKFLTDIYYAGSEDEWNNIQLEADGNDSLLNATITYNYEPETPDEPDEPNESIDVIGYQFGTLEEVVWNPDGLSLARVTIDDVEYPATADVYISPLLEGETVAYQLNENGEISWCAGAREQSVQITSWNEENKVYLGTMSDSGLSGFYYCGDTITDDFVMQNPQRLVGQTCTLVCVELYDDEPLTSNYIVLDAHTSELVCGTVRIFDPLSVEVFLEGQEGAYAVNPEDDALQTALSDLIGQEAILTLQDEVVTAASPITDAYYMDATAKGDSGSFTWENGKYSLATTNVRVVIRVPITDKYTELSEVLKQQSINVTDIQVELEDNDYIEVSQQPVLEEANELLVACDPVVYNIQLSLKDTDQEPSVSATLPTLKITVKGEKDGISIQDECSVLISIHNVDEENRLAEERRKAAEKAEQEAIREAEKAAEEAEEALEDLDALEDLEEDSRYMALPPELSNYFTEDQLQSLKISILTQIALANAPKQTWEEWVGDTVMQLLFKKVFKVNNPDLEAERCDIPMTLRGQTKDGDPIQVNVMCTLTDFTLKDNQFAFAAKMDFTLALEEPHYAIKEIPTPGMVVGADISAFADGAWAVAKAELQQGFNKAWGDDASKLVTPYLDDATQEAIDKVAPYFIRDPLQKILQLYWKLRKNKDVEKLMFEALCVPSKLAAAHCPVDVYVYDANQMLVGSIENNEVTLTNDNISLWVENDSKYVQVYDDGYHIEYRATDQGTMDLEIYENTSRNTPRRVIRFDDVPLETGLQYGSVLNVSDITAESQTYRLVSNEGQALEPDAIEQSDPLPLPDYILPVEDEALLNQTFAGNTIDVTQLFELIVEDDTATYTLLEGGTGTGTLTQDGTLAVTKAGTFVIQVDTMATDTHSAGSAQVTLTVDKGQGNGVLQVEDSTYPAALQPAVQDNISGGAVTYYYNTVDSNQDGTLWTADTVLDAGEYWMYARVAATDLYEAYTTPAVQFTVHPAVVSQLNLTSLITAPVRGATPQVELTAEQFTGTILWSDTPDVFAPETSYTATVKLNAAKNYTLAGLGMDSFTYTGATVNYDPTTQQVTIAFPVTDGRIIKSFTITGTPAKTTYNLGEVFDTTGLTLTVTYDDGTTETITSGYNIEPAVMAADTTQVVLSYGGVKAEPITGLTVRENLVSIQAPQAITGLPNGTEKTAKALGLPETVKITTSRTQNPTTEVAVTWDVENCGYDSDSKSAQTFTVQGMIALPDEMTNLQNVPLNIGVSVEVKANDDTPENSGHSSDSENPTTSGNTESSGVSSFSTITSEAQAASDDAGQTNAQKTIVPQTSDTFPVTGLIVLMAVSFVAVLALMVKRKKKQ